MEPRWCDRPFPGWLADPDCVWFRRTNKAIECVDLSGDFVLLGLECASGELAAVEPLDASHGCFAKRPPSIVMSSLPVHPQATMRKAQMSLLAWIDFDEAKRQRAQRIMALLQERETRDELGLGGIRNSIADHLFPGTSTIC